jgi:lysophospholipase L1-like esterase
LGQRNDRNRWSRKLLGNALIALLNLAFALLIGEAVARLVFWRSMDFDMEMWKYATRIKMISDDPILQYEHRPNSAAILMGEEIATNDLGLRGNNATLDKPPGTYRIVAVGDSTTLGWGVSDEETYPAQLAALLNAAPPQGYPQGVRYEVLNLGVGNYNTVQEIGRLRDLGLQTDPDLILLGYFINDAEPTPQARHGFLIRHSYLYVFTVSRMRALNFGNQGSITYEEYYRGLYEDGQPGWAAATGALAELADVAQEQDVPVAVFIIPELHDLSANYPFADIHDTVTRVGEDVGLPVVDLFPVFGGFSPEEALWVTPADAHHNAQAQAMIAQGIYDALNAGLVEP